MTYEARWEATGAASSLQPFVAGSSSLLAALPGSSLPEAAGRRIRPLRSPRLPGKPAADLSGEKGVVLKALATGPSAAARLLSAGLQLTQRACGAAAASVGLLSRSTGAVQPAGPNVQAGPAGMAALLKVAAAEHPGCSFMVASAGHAVPALQLGLPEVCLCSCAPAMSTLVAAPRRCGPVTVSEACAARCAGCRGCLWHSSRPGHAHQAAPAAKAAAAAQARPPPPARAARQHGRPEAGTLAAH